VEKRRKVLADVRESKDGIARNLEKMKMTYSHKKEELKKQKGLF
jgi:hypothetical protein